MCEIYLCMADTVTLSISVAVKIYRSPGVIIGTGKTWENFVLGIPNIKQTKESGI